MSCCFVIIVIFFGFFLLGMLFILWGILLLDIVKDLCMFEFVSGIFFFFFSIGMMLGVVIGGKYVSCFDYMLFLVVLFSINVLLLFIIF